MTKPDKARKITAVTPIEHYRDALLFEAEDCWIPLQAR